MDIYFLKQQVLKISTAVKNTKATVANFTSPAKRGLTFTHWNIQHNAHTQTDRALQWRTRLLWQSLSCPLWQSLSCLLWQSLYKFISSLHFQQVHLSLWVNYVRHTYTVTVLVTVRCFLCVFFFLLSFFLSNFDRRKDNLYERQPWSSDASSFVQILSSDKVE